MTVKYRFKMLHISLFSGIGGFDLAAEWAGWTNIVSCEINPFGNKVLNHYWPNAYHHTDIHTLTIEKINEELTKRHGEQWRTDDIVLSGGFPCQPYSLAGKRLGKEDERHLWPEMLRVIREIQPTWIVGENVFGLVNWSDGLVFDEVQTDLETQGYEVQSYVLPACAADAPHRRDRVWIVAHATGNKSIRNRQGGLQSELTRFDEQGITANAKPTGLEGHDERIRCAEYWRNERLQFGAENKQSSTNSNGAPTKHTIQAWRNLFASESGERVAANTHGDGQQRSNGKNEVNASEGGQYAQRDVSACAKYGPATYANGIRQPGEKHGHQESGISCENSKGISWHNFPTQSPVCSRNDGIPAGLDGITFSKWRNESIKAAGNAIVPQIAYRIFDTINQYNKQTEQ
jgi:DNA (cytosine-5)-methyltransferase 1